MEAITKTVSVYVKPYQSATIEKKKDTINIVGSIGDISIPIYLTGMKKQDDYYSATYKDQNKETLANMSYLKEDGSNNTGF